MTQMEQLEAENTKLHNRCNLLKNRLAHIETYLGLRDHAFAEGERQWDFQQVAQDVNNDRIPRSHFNRGNRRRRTEEERLATQ